MVIILKATVVSVAYTSDNIFRTILPAAHEYLMPLIELQKPGPQKNNFILNQFLNK